MTFILKSRTKLQVFNNGIMMGTAYSVNNDITLEISEIYAGCVAVKYDIDNYGMINIYGDRIVLINSCDERCVMYDDSANINHIIDLALKDGE